MNDGNENTLQWKDLSLRVKLAIGISKAAKKLTRIAKFTAPLLNAVNLGLLPKKCLFQLVKYSYETHPDYYNPDTYSYTWEEDIIDSLKEATGRKNLLVAFCGKGREAKIFSNHGYEVTGIDREPFMIKDAIKFSAESNFKADFKCANFDDYTTSDPYDIVYTSTWMYTTYLDAEDRYHFLKKCVELCAPNGIIIISYRTRKNRLSDSISHAIAKTTAFLTLGNRGLTKGDRIEKGLFWHYFSNEEIEEELDRAGMKTIFQKPSDDGYLDWRFLKTSE